MSRKSTDKSTYEGTKASLLSKSIKNALGAAADRYYPGNESKKMSMGGYASK